MTRRYAGPFMIAVPILLALIATAAQRADFVRDEETELLDFHYAWPAAADAVPMLRARLQREMGEAHDEALANAEQVRAYAREHGLSYNPMFHEQDWLAAGNASQLLSLSATVHSFTGGAHPNTDFMATLWDRALDEAVGAAALLGPTVLAGLTPRFCEALDTQRAEVRGEPIVREDGTDPFTACPALAEQVLVPADTDDNGRFDTLRILIPPYVAGPYVDGAYVIELRFGAADVAGISDGYRPAFEMAGKREMPVGND